MLNPLSVEVTVGLCEGREWGDTFKVLFTTLILQAYTCELVLFCAIHLFRGTVLPFLSATKEMMTAITDTKRHRLPQEYCAST